MIHFKKTVKKEQSSLDSSQLHNCSPSTGRDWEMGRRAQAGSYGEMEEGKRKDVGRRWTDVGW